MHLSYPLYTSKKTWLLCVPQKKQTITIIQHIWVNYNISLTWIKAILGWFPLLTMIPVRENSEVVIIYPEHIATQLQGIRRQKAALFNQRACAGSCWGSRPSKSADAWRSPKRLLPADQNPAGSPNETIGKWWLNHLFMGISWDF